MFWSFLRHSSGPLCTTRIIFILYNVFITNTSRDSPVALMSVRHVYSLWSLQWQTVGLIIQSQLFASRAVGQLFDVDQTALAPTRCSQRPNFKMDLTVQSV